MSGKLRQHEAKILEHLELNAQLSSREVAKRLRLREATVQHTLRKLRERGAVQIRPFIDISALGLLDVGIFFSLAITQQRLYSKFMQRLISSPRVTFVHTVAGDFNFLAALHCHSLSEAQEFLHDISKWSAGSVITKSVSPRLRYHQYRRKYLTEVRPKEVALVALNSNKRVELSPDEFKLLAHLSDSNTDSIREAARQLGEPASTIDYRYKQLVEKGIIRGWFYDINDIALTSQRFKLLISCKQLSVELTTAIEAFTRFHPRVTYMLETLGEWDFEIGIECGRTADVMEIISLIYERFPTQISGIRSLTELDSYKFNMFPGLAIAFSRSP
ncbi:MAG: winged helix-turn-helix transcriptional regulator [Pseudomonadota bacterium]